MTELNILVDKARLCEQIELYDEMYDLMEKRVKLNIPLNEEERNNFSVACKN